MKKWEYMFAEFMFFGGLKLYRLNGVAYKEDWKQMGLIPNFIPTIDTLCIDFINKAGEQGWESVNMTRLSENIVVLFKRELKS